MKVFYAAPVSAETLGCSVCAPLSAKAALLFVKVMQDGALPHTHTEL